MFRKLFRFFYSKVFIGIHLDKDICQVNIIVVKNNKIKKNITTEAKYIHGIIPMEMLKLIHFYQRRYPFTYIGMISKTKDQGVIPTTNPQEFLQHGINAKQNHLIPINHTWSAYIDKNECYKLTHQIKDLGALDCLFSPFLFIFMEAKKHERLALYILQEKEYIFLAICDHKQIHFSKVFNLHQESPDLQTTQALSNADSSLDQLLAKLDTGLDRSDSQTQETQVEEEQTDELNDFVRATFSANFIEETLQEYYATRKSSFINQIIILDTYGIHPNSLKYIQETLLIELQVIPFAPAGEITSLIFREFRRKAL